MSAQQSLAFDASNDLLGKAVSKTKLSVRECLRKKHLLHRIHELVSIVPITGCWMWMGVITPSGYAQTTVWDGTRNMGLTAHRVVYVEAKGDVPTGFHIDHLCRNRWCVNPDHLEAVSPDQNWLRGNGTPSHNARKTHCNAGHPLSGQNLKFELSGGRRCIACRRARYLERKQRQKAAGGAK